MSVLDDIEEQQRRVFEFHTNTLNAYNGFRTHEFANGRNRIPQQTPNPPNQAQIRYQNHNKITLTNGHILCLGLIILVAAIVFCFFLPEPLYSFTPSYQYPIERITPNLLISYYVKENFTNEYKGSLANLEVKVEEKYISNIEWECISEKNNREEMISLARTHGSWAQYIQAKSIKTPSCVELYRLRLLKRTAHKKDYPQ